MVVKPSQVYNGDSYTDKTSSFQWINAQEGIILHQQSINFLDSINVIENHIH